MTVIIIITRVNTNKLRKLDFSPISHGLRFGYPKYLPKINQFFLNKQRGSSLVNFDYQRSNFRFLQFEELTRLDISVHLIQINIYNFEFWGIAFARMKIGILADGFARGIMYKETLKKMRLNVGMLRW